MRFRNRLHENTTLDIATPYMLRNDGQLLECGDLHPYIFENIYKPISYNIETLINNHIDDLIWFYNNSTIDVKNHISSLLKSLLISNSYNIDKSIILNSDVDIQVDNYSDKSSQIEDLFELISNETNQLFCRVRTSSLIWAGTSNEIYFRISSVGFNWFNLIWKIVYDNKNFISNVSICNDSRVDGSKTVFYTHNGELMKHIPVNDFILLSGNPIFETKDKYLNNLINNKSLIESFNNIYCTHINRLLKSYRKNSDYQL